MARIEDLVTATPVFSDLDLFADISDSNNAKKNTIGQKVKAGLADPTVTADDLQDWATKKVLTATERTKLAGIQVGAQVNTVTSVNWQMGVVVLDADDIADTAARKMGNEIFNTSEKDKLDTAYTHSQAVTGNPHNVTAAQVWLGNVANERQLSRTAGNFNALPLKTDIQRNLNDLMVIQDDFDSDNIKKVTVGTQYIRYSSTIQLWRTSVNYHADTLVNSTTYEIRNIVIDEVTGGMYYCTVSHQSGANFASDLALWYWTPVLAWGGGSSPVYVIRGATNPTQAIPWWPRTPSGAFAGQLFANTVTADILVRDGNDWILNSAWGGWSWVNITVWVWVPVGSGTNPWDMYIDYNTANIYVWNGTSWVVNNATGGSWSWIIYSLSNWTVVPATTGDRWLASTLTGADKAYETSQTINPLTGHTINQTFWWLITWLSTSIQNFIAGAILQWSVIFNNLTVNNTGSTNYNNGIYNNPTINNPTITWTSSQSDWQQSNNTLPDFIKNKVVRPDQLWGTTTNGKWVVRDTNGTFRDLAQSDITALGFTPWSNSWWPVDWLDGIVFSDTSMEFKANYRWNTLWTWSELWAWCWYDNVTKSIFVSNDNNIKRYDINWNLQNTITTSWIRWMIKGNNTSRLLFTLNWCQKVDLDTYTVSWSSLWTTLDISPSGDFVISAITNNSNQFVIRKYDTATLSTISTYTYNYPVPWNSNNWFGGATMIDDITIAILIHDWLWLSVWTAKVIKVDISTWTIIWTHTFAYPWWPIAINWIQYSTHDTLIYYKEYITLKSITVWLTSPTTITPPAWTNRSYFQIYRCSDWSLWTLAQSTLSPLDFTSALVVNASSKWWKTFSFTTSQSSQLTPIY